MLAKIEKYIILADTMSSHHTSKLRQHGTLSLTQNTDMGCGVDGRSGEWESYG
jgi:hypothetical protein